jgi:hypothetical protein
MRTQHLLLLSSIALSSPALAAEPKSTANPNAKRGVESISRADAPVSTAAGDEMIQNHPPRKNRIRYTIPPSAKRM